jgi:undecaprenyl-diphosphatase
MALVSLLSLLVLAFLQGVLEWLPASSEGQVMLVAVLFFGMDASTALSIAIWLHLGTATAVLVYYRADIFGPLYHQLVPDRSGTKSGIESARPSAMRPGFFGPLFRFVLVGTIGTAIVALPMYLLLRTLVTELLGESISALIGALLLITGALLYFQRGKQGGRRLASISLKEAFVLGLVHGFSVLPGISRTGVTLTWLLLRQVDRDEALRLSFVLGVPAVAGVVGLNVLQGTVLWIDPIILATLVLVTLVVGLGSLATLRRFALRVPFWAFCFIIGIAAVVFAFIVVLTFPVLPPT